MLYLHLLIGLISFKKHCRVAKHLVPVLKRVIQTFNEILRKI